MEARMEALKAEQALLRNRVRHKLAWAAGEAFALPALAHSTSVNHVQRPTRPAEGPSASSAAARHFQQIAHASGPEPALVHTELQKALLEMLVEEPSIILPAHSDYLLRLAIERNPGVHSLISKASPRNVELALTELSGIAPHAVRVEHRELMWLDQTALSDFRMRLVGNSRAGQAARPPPAIDNGGAHGSAPAPSAPGASAGKGTGKKRSATTVHDDELAEVFDLVDKKSTRQQALQEEQDQLLELLAKPSAKVQHQTDRFRTSGGSKLKQFCRSGTKEDCARLNGTGYACDSIHFRRIIRPHTDPSLGDCSYLDTCRHMEKCKFIHYEVDAGDAERMRDGAVQLDPHARTAINRKTGGDDPFAMHYESQFVNCDIRTFPMACLGKFAVIMADPPWDIHMELPYGTMSDDEMRRMDVQVLQDDGVIFLWVTGRAMELGRECLSIWGYRFVQELLWVKTNQLQRIIRTGRTGHWINHSKEHCLVGVKGQPDINWNLDCDVVCAEVRETSRKPDEMYDLLERLAPGTRKLELFGRPHNVHKGWTTLGNQLGKTRITEPWLREHLLREGVFAEEDLAPLPEPPKHPVVQPWGGHPPPAPLPSLNPAPNTAPGQA